MKNFLFCVILVAVGYSIVVDTIQLKATRLPIMSTSRSPGETALEKSMMNESIISKVASDVNELNQFKARVREMSAEIQSLKEQIAMMQRDLDNKGQEIRNATDALSKDMTRVEKRIDKLPSVKGQK